MLITAVLQEMDNHAEQKYFITWNFNAHSGNLLVKMLHKAQMESFLSTFDTKAHNEDDWAGSGIPAF